MLIRTGYDILSGVRARSDSFHGTPSAPPPKKKIIISLNEDAFLLLVSCYFTAHLASQVKGNHKRNAVVLLTCSVSKQSKKFCGTSRLHSFSAQCVVTVYQMRYYLSKTEFFI